MDHRQRGVAHVNIFWCLVPLVLMFGAAGYGYMKHVEADENLAARISAKEKLKKEEHLVFERNRQLSMLTEVLGNAGEFLGPVEPRDDYSPPKNYTTPEKIKIAFAQFNGKLGNPTALATLNDVLGAAASKLDAQKAAVAGLEKQLADARAERDSARTAGDTVKSDLDAKITGLETNLANERNKLDRQVADYAAQLADARQKTAEANKARDDAAKEATQKIAAKDKEILALEAANLAKQDRLKLINSPQEPDGTVLSSSPLTGTAWVNIGAKDMVKTGLALRILEPQPGGKYRLKGHGYVTDVEHDRARVKITNLLNELDPVVRNDVVANDLYSPALKRRIYLIGRFGAPYTKGELKRILENMGNEVSDVMDPTVDLVIVGRQPIGAQEEITKIEDTEEFRKASAWNVEIAQLAKIRDFLRL